MKTIFKSLLLSFLTLTSLNAAPARGGVIIFTQPDGTKFQGTLKGDSAFHWIESNSNIVLYNPKDKFYYNAVLDANEKLVLGTTKPKIIKVNTDNVTSYTSTKKANSQTLASDIINALKQIRIEAHTGNHPR